MTKIVGQAAETGATPVTTAKDMARLSPALRALVEVLHVMIEWEEDGAIDALAGAV